ncbi:MAG: 50S ribosomal protein L9 [Candidatus Niyogibacteria bacterium]|nr:50S ribosomal protein L9 [Candidatus Niyogibacteria bacterium]
MKVILLRDVPKIGKKGEVKEIGDGYARNLLIPRGLAKPATEGIIKDAAARAATSKAIREKELLDIATAFKKLGELEIKFSAKANERGHLFAGIGREEITEKINAAGFKQIVLKDIELPETLKQTGEFYVAVHHGEFSTKIKVIIQSK